MKYSTKAVSDKDIYFDSFVPYLYMDTVLCAKFFVRSEEYVVDLRDFFEKFPRLQGGQKIQAFSARTIARTRPGRWVWVDPWENITYPLADSALQKLNKYAQIINNLKPGKVTKIFGNCSVFLTGGPRDKSFMCFAASISGNYNDWKNRIQMTLTPEDDEVLPFMVNVKHALEQGIATKKTLLSKKSNTYYEITKSGQLNIYQNEDSFSNPSRLIDGGAILAGTYVFGKRKVVEMYKKLLMPSKDKAIFVDYLESIGETL